MTKQHAPWMPWLVCFGGALFCYFLFIQWGMFNALSVSLMHDEGWSSGQIAQLSALYFYANVLFLFPAGLILDRYPIRPVMLLSMGLAVVASFWFAGITTFWQAAVCRFLVGSAGAFCVISNVRLATRWFPSKRLGLIIGLIIMLGLLGSMSAQTPFTYITDHWGWRTTLLINATIGLALLMVMLLLVRDSTPAWRDQIGVDDSHHGKSSWKDIWLVFKNRNNWLAGLYASLMNVPILVFMTWGYLYLSQAWGMSRTEASYVVDALIFGNMLGSPLISALSDYLNKRRMPMLISSILAFFLSLILVSTWLITPVWLTILFVVIGFLCGAQVISYAFIAECNADNLMGAAEGVGSVLIMAGGIAVQLFPYLLRLPGDMTVIAAVPQFTRHDYRLALQMVPAAFAVATLIACFLKSRRNQLLDVKADQANQSEYDDVLVGRESSI